ncbi:hypothetical protein ABPG77_002223 [Micractinium sp. CCAP 211/92]
MAAARRAAAAAAQQAAPSIRLAVVGDVHSQWDADSEAALLSLGADIAVFVGDFGEENVQLIKRIAALPCPKAVILGNHDAWFSLTKNGRQRYARAMAASTTLAAQQQQAFSAGSCAASNAWARGSTPAIAAQLQALGDDHIGYSSKRFDHLGLSLLGARPFSKGGKQWSDVADFYAEHYGIRGMQDSAMRILDVALAAPDGDVKVLVAHNGPRGLGGRRHNICGVDWTEPEADFGDPDLAEALDMLSAQGVRVPLVLFGHMHSQLKGSGLRNMVEVDPASGTVYLNAAVVPRVRRLPLPADGGAASGTSTGGGAAAGDTIPCHHFLVVELRHGVVAAARDAWVGVQHAGSDSSGGGAGGSRRCIIVREQELLKTSLPPAETLGGPEAAAATGRALQGAADGISSSRAAAGLAEDCGNGSSTGSYVCSIYRAHTGEWEPFVLQLPAAAAAVAAPERQLAEVS